MGKDQAFFRIKIDVTDKTSDRHAYSSKTAVSCEQIVTGVSRIAVPSTSASKEAPHAAPAWMVNDIHFSRRCGDKLTFH